MAFVASHCPPSARGTEEKVELAVRQYRTKDQHCYLTLFDTKTGLDVAGVQNMTIEEGVGDATMAVCRLYLHQPAIEVVVVEDESNE